MFDSCLLKGFVDVGSCPREVMVGKWVEVADR